METPRITPAEQTVIRHMAEGLTDVEISQRIGCSLNTVGGHLRHVRGKLGVETRFDVYRWALALGIVDPPSVAELEEQLCQRQPGRRH